MTGGNLTVVEPMPDDAVLHAYVDGEIDPGERSGVEAWLAVNPEMRTRVESWRNQNLALHRLSGERGSLPPMPPEMARAAARLGTLYGRRRLRFRLDVRMAAAVALVLSAGAATAVGLQSFQESGRDDAALAFARQAAAAHRDYAALADLHAGEGEFGSTTVAARLAGIAAKPPDLGAAGFAVAMHRVLRRPDGAAAQILYTREDGKRVTLYLGPSQGGGARQFTFRQDDGVSMLYWQSGEVAFSLIGKLEEAALLDLARSVSTVIDQPLAPDAAPGQATDDAVVSVGATGEKLPDGDAAPAVKGASPAVDAPAANAAEPTPKVVPETPLVPAGKAAETNEPQET